MLGLKSESDAPGALYISAWGEDNSGAGFIEGFNFGWHEFENTTVEMGA